MCARPSTGSTATIFSTEKRSKAAVSFQPSAVSLFLLLAMPGAPAEGNPAARLSGLRSSRGTGFKPQGLADSQVLGMSPFDQSRGASGLAFETWESTNINALEFEFRNRQATATRAAPPSTSTRSPQPPGLRPRNGDNSTTPSPPVSLPGPAPPDCDADTAASPRASRVYAR